MGGGGVFQKPNVGGLGVGVRPTSGLMNNPDYLISKGRYDWTNPNAQSVNPHGIANQPWSMGVGTSVKGFPNQATSGMLGGINSPGESSSYYPGSDVPTYGGPKIPNEFTAADIAALQLEYDTDEALRQDKLDKMSQLAQGKGGSGGGVSGQIVGDGGDLGIQQVAMNRGKDGFPTLADFEQPLHPFMGKRKLNLKGYA